MWLCVVYSPPLILHWQLAFASSRSHYCMNVTECFVFPSLLLSLQMAFASPRSHYCTNCTVWFVSPSPFMCLQMAFASPRSHYFTNCTVQNAPKMGSKWAHFTRLCTPNGLG